VPAPPRSATTAESPASAAAFCACAPLEVRATVVGELLVVASAPPAAVATVGTVDPVDTVDTVLMLAPSWLT
jgi:hypothetical protein